MPFSDPAFLTPDDKTMATIPNANPIIAHTGFAKHPKMPSNDKMPHTKLAIDLPFISNPPKICIKFPDCSVLALLYHYS